MKLCYIQRVRQFDAPAFFLGGREVTLMEIKDWVELICSIGNFVVSLINLFRNKK